MAKLNIKAMSEAIQNVITLCGTEVLINPNCFCAALRDFLTDISLQTEQKLLILIANWGIGKVIFKAINTSAHEERNQAIFVANKIMLEEIGLIAERRYSVLEAYINALAWDNINLSQVCKSEVLYSTEGLVNEVGFESKPVVGGTITFGRYKWIVLSIYKDMMLLLSEEVLAVNKPYNDRYNIVTWKTCSLRAWLNNDFLFEEFTQKEQERIVLAKNVTENNPWYETTGGEDTDDKIILLTVNDVVRYFGDSGHLKKRPNNQWIDESIEAGKSYAIDDKYNEKRRAKYKDEATWWWLRTPGLSGYKAAYVNVDGIIFIGGETVSDDGGSSCVGIRPGVRPAIWVHI